MNRGVKLAAVLALAYQANALTLKEAVLHTISTNPTVLERVKNYNATREDLEIAKSGWLPKLDYVGSVGQEWGEREINDYDWRDYHVFENSLLLSQNIFNGWSTSHQIETQEARVLAAAYKYIEVVHDTSYRLVNYYLEVIKSRELLKIAEENIRNNEEIFAKVSKLYENGLTTKSEREKAAASLSLARSNYVVQRNNLDDAIRQFKYYYGKEVSAQELEEPGFGLSVPASYEAGRDFALKYNPSILVQRYNIEVAKEDHLEKKSRYYPKVDLNARGSWNYNANGELYGHEDVYRVGATMTYNLFNGFADKAAVQKGVSRIQQEVMVRNDLVRKTEESFDLSWNAYRHLRDKLNYLLRYRSHAADTLRLYSKEYEMGRRTLLDLLSAQNDLINAKSQIVATLYGYLFAKYRILDAMGTMVPVIVGRTQDYFRRVGLQSDTDPAKDLFPEAEMDANDAFLQEVLKKTEEDRLLLFDAEQTGDDETRAALADTDTAGREKGIVDERMTEDHAVYETEPATDVVTREPETPLVSRLDGTEGKIKVLQFIMTKKKYRKETEKAMRRFVAMGLSCYIKDSVDGVHIYLRCLPEEGKDAETMAMLREKGIDFMITTEDASYLKAEGVESAPRL